MPIPREGNLEPSGACSPLPARGLVRARNNRFNAPDVRRQSRPTPTRSIKDTA